MTRCRDAALADRASLADEMAAQQASYSALQAQLAAAERQVCCQSNARAWCIWFMSSS
jgi:hypothetical protein